MRDIIGWIRNPAIKAYNKVNYKRNNNGKIIGINSIEDHKGFSYTFDGENRPVSILDKESDLLTKMTYEYTPNLVVSIYRIDGSGDPVLKYRAYYDAHGTLIALRGADLGGNENSYDDYRAEVVYDDITGEVLTATTFERSVGDNNQTALSESTEAYYNGTLAAFTGESWTITSSLSTEASPATLDALNEFFESQELSIKDAAGEDKVVDLIEKMDSGDTALEDKAIMESVERDDVFRQIRNVLDVGTVKDSILQTLFTSQNVRNYMYSGMKVMSTLTLKTAYSIGKNISESVSSGTFSSVSSGDLERQAKLVSAVRSEDGNSGSSSKNGDRFAGKNGQGGARSSQGQDITGSGRSYLGSGASGSFARGALMSFSQSNFGGIFSSTSMGAAGRVGSLYTGALKKFIKCFFR